MTSPLNEMQQLRKRYEDLDRMRTVCQTNLANATRTLEALQAQAREQYQTDDLEALHARLEQMKAGNQRLQEDYRASLDTIEASLKAVDQACRAEA